MFKTWNVSKKISLLLQCGQSSGCNIWKKYRAINSVENHPRSVRLCATSKQQDKILIRLSQSMRRFTSKRLNAEWLKYQVNILDSTVQKLF